MLTLAASFSSSLLANPYVVVVRCHVRHRDDQRSPGCLVDPRSSPRATRSATSTWTGTTARTRWPAAKAAAYQLGLKLVEHKIKPTDADLTAQVTASKNAGAKAVLLTTTACADRLRGLRRRRAPDTTRRSWARTRRSARRCSRARRRSALETKLYVVSSIAPFSSDAAGPTQVRQSFTTKFPDQPQVDLRHVRLRPGRDHGADPRGRLPEQRAHPARPAQRAPGSVEHRHPRPDRTARLQQAGRHSRRGRST